MEDEVTGKIIFPEIGICGLSCRLCPNYHMHTPSRCLGCKSQGRMAVGCPFITCALKKKGIEFCWQCAEKTSCEKWQKHRDAGTQKDSFKCYQSLEKDIAFVEANGVEAYARQQQAKEELLVEMLEGFNEGRSKSYYCIAATVMEVGELRAALAEATSKTVGQNLATKAKALHQALDAIAARQGYYLKLRK
jgi:hypothetical protein